MRKEKVKYFILTMVLTTCMLINLTLKTEKVQAEYNKMENNIDKNKPNKPTINKINERYVLKDNGDNEINSSGIKEIQYSVDNGVTWEKYREPIKWIYDEGNIQAKVIDNAGNESEIENTKMYDTLPWIRSFGGSRHESYTSVVETKDNGYIAVGYGRSDDKDLTGLSKGGSDALIVKYDLLGNVLLKKTFGGSEGDFFESVICTKDNEYVVVGYTDSTDGDLTGMGIRNTDGIIVKYDSLGNVKLKKTFSGEMWEYFRSVDLTKDGGYIVVGSSDSTTGDLQGLNKGADDGVIVKYDSLGNIQFKKTFGGSNTDIFYSVKAVNDGYIAVGYSESNDKDLMGLSKGNMDSIIVKYDLFGNVEWKKSFGGSKSDFFRDVIPTEDNGYIAVGSSDSSDGDLIEFDKRDQHGTIVKYDNLGNVVWKNNFNKYPQNKLNSISCTEDNEYIVVGYCLNYKKNISYGYEDFAIMVKYDSLGNEIENRAFEGSGSDVFNKIINTNDNGNVIVGMSSSNDIDASGLNTIARDGVILKIKDDLKGPQYIVNKSPENYTKDNVNLNIKATSPYGIKWIKDDYGHYIYNDEYNESISENGKYLFKIKDNNLVEKDFTVDINNIDNYKPNKPNIEVIDDSFVINDQGDPISIIQKDIIENFEGPSLSFNPISNGQWYKTEESYSSGKYSYRSPKIKDNESTDFNIRFTIPENSTENNFSFMYKVDSENQGDYFSMYLDGEIILRYSGQKDWNHFEFTVTPGNHTVKFQYTKNSGYSEGSDAVYIDDIVIKSGGEINVPSSGVKEILYKLNQSETWNKYNDSIPLNIGENNIQAKVIDNAGNESEIESAKVYNALPWIRSFGGSSYESYSSVAETKDNGYIAVGYSMSKDKDLTGLSKGGSDALIVKYDLLGNLLWKKTFGGSGTEFFQSVICTNDNEYVAVGYSDSKDKDLTGMGISRTDAMIVKYDSSGEILFKKNFSGENDELFLSISLAEDEGYIVVGTSNSTTGNLQGLNKGGLDGIIIKYDSLGNVQFKNNFGGTNEDRFSSVEALKDGYIAVGYSESNDKDLMGLSKGKRDSIIVKYDLMGNVQWKKTFGGSQMDRFEDVIPTEDNGYIAVGTSESTDGDLIEFDKAKTHGTIVKYDNMGNVVWKNTFSEYSKNTLNSISRAENNKYIVTGYGVNYPKGTGDGDEDFGVIVKFDSLGKEIEKRSFWGSEGDSVEEIINTNDNGYIVVGNSDSFDGDLNNLNKGTEDAVILKIKDSLNDINYTVNKTPESYTKESVNLNIKADSPYGIKWIKNDYGRYTYGNEYNESISENGKYLFRIKDNNLVEKTFTVDVNNIDKYKPNKPNVEVMNDSFVINGQGDSLNIIQKDITENFEGPSLSFNPILNGQWYKTEENYSSGKYSYRSPKINSNEVTDFNIRFTIPENSTENNFSFSYKVDSEYYGDYFSMYLDGELILKDSGQKGWNQFEFTVTPGNHTVEFQYIKNSSYSIGTDAVFIDNIVIKTGGEISVPSSGVKEVLYKLDQSNTWNKYNDLIPLNIGENKIQAKTVDNAGNESDVVELTEVLDGLEVVFNNNLIDFGIVDGPSKEKEITLEVISSENYSIFINGIDDFINETMKSIPLNILKVKADDNPFQTMEKNKNIVLKDNVEKGNNNHIISFSIANYIGNEKGKYKSNMDISIMQK